MANSVFVLLISVLFLMCMCSLIPNGQAKKVCKENEYYQSVLHDCLPCEGVCEPLNRSDCQRLCKEFYRRQTACNSNQYWEKYLETCVDCSEICVPITRMDCKDRCEHYINGLKTTTTATSSSTATDKPKHTENFFSKETAEENRPGQSDVGLPMIIIVSLSALIGISLIVVICWCYKAKITALFRAMLHAVKTEKAPIQETNDPTPSSSLLEDAQQNLENEQQSAV